MKAAVVDIGGTVIKSGLFEDGKITKLCECPTDAGRGGAAVLETVTGVIKDYGAVEAVGICTTGQIDTEKGVVTFAGPNIPNYRGLEIKKTLSGQLGIPVFVENDVNAAALGEAHFGGGKDYADFLCLTYGTGIGGAIIRDGQVYHGTNFAAGEFGGIMVHPQEQNREDIFSGCYERYASVTALVSFAKAAGLEVESGRDICNRMAEPKVEKVLTAWVDEVSYGLVTLIHIFDPQMILLGGGIMEEPAITGRIQRIVKERIMESYRGVKINPATLGNRAGLYGMAYLASKEN